MESASVIYDRSGEVLSRLFVQNRDQVSVEELSPALLTAVEAAEDARFLSTTGWIIAGWRGRWCATGSASGWRRGEYDHSAVGSQHVSEGAAGHR